MVKAWKRLAKGIYEDDYSIQAIVNAGAAGRKTKRFAKDTDLVDVKRWRNKTRVALDQAARRLSPNKRRGPAKRGTLRGDVPAYLQLLAGNRRLRDEREQQLRLWIRELGALAERPRHVVTPQDVQKVLAKWARAGFAYWTLRHRRAALLALYAAMDAGDDAAVNPVSKTRVPLRKPEEEPRGFPPATVLEILAAVSDQGGIIGKGDRSKPKGKRGGRRSFSQARILIHAMAFTGMRPVELKRYSPRDWRREQHELVIHGAKGSDERVVPVIAEAEPWLDALSRLPMPLTFRLGALERAFHRALVKVGLAPASTKRTRKRTAAPRALDSKPRPRTGLPTPYDLRHSFGGTAFEQTEDLSTVQELLGHKDLRQSKRYAKNAVRKVLRSAAHKLDATWAAARSLRTSR